MPHNGGMNRLRPSLVEREAVRELLSQGYAAGRIEFDEFEARQELVGEASTVSELLTLTEGLPTDSLVFAERTPVVQPDAPAHLSVSRRALLTAGAAAVGFVAAGGLGRTLALLAGRPEPARPAERIDYFAPGRADEALVQIAEAGYRTFTKLVVNPNTVYVTALVPGSEDVADTVRVHDGELESEPDSTVQADDIRFTLDDVDLTLLQEYLAVAPQLLGGASVSQSHHPRHRADDRRALVPPTVGCQRPGRRRNRLLGHHRHHRPDLVTW